MRGNLLGWKLHGDNFEKLGWFSFENAGFLGQNYWAGAENGKVDDEGELEADEDEVDTG